MKNEMKKLLRFIIALFCAPIALFGMMLDWLYETNYDSAKDWKRYITFN